MKSDHPLCFINSVINQFQKGKDQGHEKFIIPLKLLGITKNFISIYMCYCELNVIKSKHFLKKFHKLTNDEFTVLITWKTKNIQSLFPLKDKAIINQLLFIKQIVIVVHITLIKPSVMKKLDGMNKTIQL